MMDMAERVARAIDAVQLFSRFNNWTSDRVPGLPIEICRYGQDGEDDIVVVERFGGAITEAEALGDTVSKARARAAIEAMREPSAEVAEAGNVIVRRALFTSTSVWEAMIDAALAEA